MEGVMQQVKEMLHIPDNIQPLLDNVKSLTTAAAKYAKGEGSSDELHGIMDSIKSLSTKMESIPDGPIKNMILGLKGTALKQLEGVKGADKVIEMLKGMGVKPEHADLHQEAATTAEPAAAAPTPTASVAPAAEPSA